MKDDSFSMFYLPHFDKAWNGKYGILFLHYVFQSGWAEIVPEFDSAPRGSV